MQPRPVPPPLPNEAPPLSRSDGGGGPAPGGGASSSHGPAYRPWWIGWRGAWRLALALAAGAAMGELARDLWPLSRLSQEQLDQISRPRADYTVRGPVGTQFEGLLIRAAAEQPHDARELANLVSWATRETRAVSAASYYDEQRLVKDFTRFRVNAYVRGGGVVLGVRWRSPAPAK